MSPSGVGVVSQLNISRSRVEDGGLYTCLAFEGESNTGHTARIDVYGILQILNLLLTLFNSEGWNLLFTEMSHYLTLKLLNQLKILSDILFTLATTSTITIVQVYETVQKLFVSYNQYSTSRLFYYSYRVFYFIQKWNNTSY